MAKTKTWQFALSTDNRSDNFIATNVFLHSGADTYFRSLIYCSRGSYSNSHWAEFGKMSSGQEKTIYKSWTGLTSNARYTFYGELQYSYDGSTYQVGEPTIYLEESILTQAAAPTGISASVGSSYTTISWTQPMGGGDDDIYNEITLKKGSTVVDTYTTASTSQSNRSWNYLGTLSPGTYTVTIKAKNATANYDTNISGVSSYTFTVEAPSHPDPEGNITNVTVSTEPNAATINFRWSTSYTTGYVYSWYISVGRYTSDLATETYARNNATQLSGSSCPANRSQRFTQCMGVSLQGGTRYKFRIYVFGEYDSGDSITSYSLLDTYDSEFVTSIDHLPEGTVGLTIVEAGADSALYDVDFRPGDDDQEQYWYAPVIYVSKSPNVSDSNYELSYGPLISQHYTGAGGADLRWDDYTASGLDTYSTYYAVAYMNFSAWTLTDGTAEVATGIHSAIVSFTTNGEPDNPILALWSWSSASGSWNAQRGEATSTQLSSAETAVRNGGETRNFHHVVWNDMIKWVHDASRVRKAPYKDGWPAAAKMTSSDRVLTAARWHNFAQLYNTLIPYLVSSGTDLTYYASGAPVLGRYFTEAVDNLNSYITSYKRAHG